MANNNLTVGPIQEYTDGSLEWTVFGTVDGDLRYSTSRSKDGLWLYRPDCRCHGGCDCCTSGGMGVGWKQKLGYAQFDVEHVSRATRRRRVVRLMEEFHGVGGWDR